MKEEAGQKRIQESILAPYEKKILIGIASRLPSFINSDHLTILGFAAGCLSGLFYYFARIDHLCLWVVNILIFLNWFGDSLDGTLARVRNKQRPRYGYYVDHVLDALATSAMLWGMAFSGYIHSSLALMTLCVYLIMSINAYLSESIFGSFQISYWKFSPTELRILMIIGNCYVYYKPAVNLFSYHFLLFDAGYIIGLFILFIMLLSQITRNIIKLYNEERI